MNHPLIDYLLYQADNNLILAQRNSEWCGHGPVLEQDIAISNISLDLIGQARNFYQYAAERINQEASHRFKPATEDNLAYLRGERDFSNVLLNELPKGDWAVTVTRQFFYSVYQYLLYEQLLQSRDEQIVAIAAKSLKEVAYHVKWSSEWVIRLGDGTAESNNRMTNSIHQLWPYTGELFLPSACETSAALTGIGCDVTKLKQAWTERVQSIFTEATLDMPGDVYMHTGGKTGLHTEHMGLILAEMQYLQRSIPNASW
jgi:ring-1,2-phenylacetyl-CoA epoxidase subunit PaaC